MILNNKFVFFRYIFFLFSLVFLSLNSANAANKLQSVRIWGAPDSSRVVLDLNHKPTFSYFTLTNPDRLVVDLPHTKSRLNFKKIKHNSKLIKRVRTSKPPHKGTLRIVVDLKEPLTARLFSLSPTKPYGDRLVIDLEKKVSKSIASSKTKPATTVQPKAELRDVVIAIDAGHGGDDPGSIGPRGVFEKKVTLQIAQRVADKINANHGMKAVLTRSGDYFVNLNRRSEIARKNKADLLVSIHADAFTSPRPKGASVWVLSRRRANTEIGRWLEKKEQHSELLGGAGDIIQNADKEQYLAMTLLDMSMDRSMAISHGVADDVLSDLGKVTELHKSKPESASFAVLKAPDIPSILVETGFISNPSEERKLTNWRHQDKIANAIHTGVLRYFEKTPPENTYLASKKSRKHKVRSGESLSVIAKRYGVSVNSIKKGNNLKSDMLRVGQQLFIPSS